MKKHYTNSKNIISVYRFMEICGLECKHKKNVRISHEIMRKKLELRYQSFPEAIILPQRISFDDYINEEVLSGKVVEVVDDYNKVIAYKNPILLREESLLQYLINNASKKDLKKIREKILEEQNYRVTVNGDIVKNENLEVEYEITEKSNRSRLFNNRGGRSLKRK